MWGPWMGFTLGGLLVLLLLIAIAFGTSALLIPVLLVAAFAIFAAVAYVASRATNVGRAVRAPSPDPVEDGAPASAVSVDAPPGSARPDRAPTS